MPNITLLPSAKVPLIYDGGNTMTTEWYRFFWNIYGFTGTGVIPVDKGGTGLDTIGNHQIIIGNANNVFEPASFSSSSINISYPSGYVNLELGTSTVTPGTYGSASQVGVFTVNSYGVLTAASNTSIAINANQITSGTLLVARGGTGAATLTGYVKGNGTSAFTANATVPTTDLSGTITNAQLANSTISGVALGSNLYNLTAGTGVSFSAGTTYNGSAAITINATGSGGTVTSVTGTAPVVSSGGTTPAISMPVATTSVSGYLSSTDWTTFNNKGTGSVTSVAATVPAFLSITGSPITTSGTLAITLSGTALPTANGGTGLTSFTANGILYASSSSVLATGSGLQFDGNNLSLGITSSAWSTSYKALQIAYGSLWAQTATPTFLSLNANSYYSASGYTYSTTGFASDYYQYLGTHVWRVAPSGTTGNLVTFTSAMTLHNSGGLSIGNTTDPGATNLSVTGTGKYGTTIGVGATTPAASGAGISFPATQSPSTNANTLDDYKEGTWTPTDASGAGLTFTYSGCKYTKIGRIVHLQGTITYPSTASTASAIWGGFPYNAADAITLSVIYTDAPTNTFNYLSANSTNVYLLVPGVNVTNVTMSGKTVIFSGTYTT